MCGILAIIGVGQPYDPVLADLALNTLAHRGPDDHGIWHGDSAWMGHRRLSIIDTSSGGHQPMVDAATGVVITFNGEIYNYIELRAELVALGQQFHSQSDTEVLLRAYLMWGQQCVRRFNGDWAFVIWDPRTRTAFISRDRFAVKPLYFARVGGAMAVASEPKALLHLYPQLRKVNERALFRFLKESALYDHAECFYEGIELLLPAHNAVYKPDDDALVLRRYWDWPSADVPVRGDIQEQFNTLLEDAVRLRMRSDVQVGVTLSGGLDSTAVMTVAEKQLEQSAARMTAFTSVYESNTDAPGVDERDWAILAAAPCNQVNLQMVDAPKARWLKTLRIVIKHMDGPGYSPAVFPLWVVADAASSQSVNVLLEGQGADELLGGYADYAAAAFIQNVWRLLMGMRWLALCREMKGFASVFGLKFFLMRLMRQLSPSVKAWNHRQNGVLGTMRKNFVARVADACKAYASGPKNTASCFAECEMRLDFSSRILPGLLQYGDTVSMANGVESRLPFLDYRLVEFCARLPLEWKIRNGQTKYILRQYLRANGQHEIGNRMDKKGYPTPIDALFKQNNGQFLRDLLLAPNARVLAYCDPVLLTKLVDKFLAGNGRTENPLYRLVSTELWLQECIPV
jgi:asparagine synthase (glutamine-hydrolysing)